MSRRLPRILAFVCTLALGLFMTESTAKAEEIKLGLNGGTVRLQLPDGWHQIPLRIPREEDRQAVSEMVIAYPPEGGQVPTIYVRLDLRPLNSLEGLSLVENMIDELRSFQQNGEQPPLLTDCSGTQPSGYVYRFEEQITLYDGSKAKVSVNQDACGVQTRARINLDDQKALEIGMASPPESFEASYSDIFVPALASAWFERLGVDDTHQKDPASSVSLVIQ